MLKHHPDKRRARGVAVPSESEDYFTCITKAYEQLSNPEKRAAYDSVDPEFDDSIPTAAAVTPDNFYQIFTTAFENNERSIFVSFISFMVNIGTPA